MLAAQIWHWWIGLITLIAGVGLTLQLVVGYVKQVTSQKYPGGKRHREREL